MFTARHTLRSGSPWSGALASTERRSQIFLCRVVSLQIHSSCIFDVRHDPHRLQQTEDGDSIMEAGVGVDQMDASYSVLMSFLWCKFPVRERLRSSESNCCSFVLRGVNLGRTAYPIRLCNASSSPRKSWRTWLHRRMSGPPF